jgi:alpha-methylacyl-CoA racemase
VTGGSGGYNDGKLLGRRAKEGIVSFSLWNDEQDRPIQHLRIVDMTVMLPGPYLTRILSQYGADVIKVEALPNGDPVRSLKDTSLFELLNRGKRSIGVNLRSEEGIAIVRQLAGEADVFVENFREGVADSMKLGYSELSEENPDLLYLSIRGLSGKNAAHAGHDLNFIAQSGVGEWYLENGVPNYSTLFGDIVGGTLTPALKLMMHLANPNRRGMHLVSYMDEGFRSLYLARAFDSYKAESLPEDQRAAYGTHKTFDGSLPHSRFYRCRDGQWVSLNGIQEKHWKTFCEVVDRSAWTGRGSDPSLVPDMEKLFLDAPAAYWEALAGTRELCLFRVVPWEEHISFSQARPQLSTDPLSWAGFAPNAALGQSPALGADTYGVLHSMGVSNKEISDWAQAGVLLNPKA